MPCTPRDTGTSLGMQEPESKHCLALCSATSPLRGLDLCGIYLKSGKLISPAPFFFLSRLLWLFEVFCVPIRIVKFFV